MDISGNHYQNNMDPILRRSIKNSKPGVDQIMNVAFTRREKIGISAAIVCLFLSTTTAVFGQTIVSTDLGIVVLSHRFEDNILSAEIIGEVMNNDSRSYDRYDINIYANFRDETGALVSSEQGFIDAETLGEGENSAFNVFILDDDIGNKAKTYDLIINDERVIVGEPLDGGESNSDNDKDDDDSDEGRDGENVGCSSNLECQLEGNEEWALQHIGNTEGMTLEDKESAMNDVLDDVDEDYLDKHNPDLSENNGDLDDDADEDEEGEEDRDG